MTAAAVGVIGLGIMGSAYARNLLEGGVPVLGHDPSPEAQAALRDAGGTPLPGPREVAEAARTLLFALPSAEVLEATVEAMLPALGPGHVIAEMGTLPLRAKEAARARVAPTGAVLLDCPVSGTGAQAAAGDLVVFMSGEEEACERLRPALAPLARDIRHVGPFGAGMKLKLVANLLVTIHNLSAAEALNFARQAGLDLRMVYEAVRTGAGGSRMFDLRAPLMIDGAYEPATMKMEVYMKDLALIMEEAAALGAPVPLMAASLPFYHAALAQGRHKQDTAALYAVLERMTGAAE